MPTFAYTARDMTGKQVNGTVEATGEREVATMLSERSLFPVNVKGWQQPDAKQFLAAANESKARRWLSFIPNWPRCFAPASP